MSHKISNKQMVFEIIYYTIVCLFGIYIGYYLSRYGIIYLNKTDGQIITAFEDEEYIIKEQNNER